MIDVYSRDYTEAVAQTTTRWWGFFGGSKESNLSYNRGKYKSNTLPQIQTFFRERKKYTIEDMQQYLRLSSSMQKITLKTAGNGKIQINSIIPDTSGGWSGEYSADCPVTLTALPDDGAQFTGWSGDVSTDYLYGVSDCSLPLSKLNEIFYDDMTYSELISIVLGLSEEHQKAFMMILECLRKEQNRTSE
ncbi:hypothetical protein [uncultured Ruminococcus sp.]|uniref:InlB B-repeat-containing protein n=1 Tax=uncultured Ruminococcus sp. TaxID=165186 RepID=UPI002631DAFE|nr:hypothetical protein [uncultured Ruminococcus sp.]